MNITVVGTGYVGLVTGACFADTGVKVTCVDIDKEKIDKLNKGIIPIYEPGLEDIVLRNIEKKRLFFTTSLKDAISDSEVVFIAVGTPPNEDGSADINHVLTVAENIGEYIDHYLVVVNKSTVPVGTAEKVRETIKRKLIERQVDIDFDVASNPEFLKEGTAVVDFLRPERIIIGTDSERSKEILAKLYHPFILNGHPVIFMSIPSAELTKYAANAMLALRISFMNEMAQLCEKIGANIHDIRKGIGSDSRIGNKFLYAGIGYGGSCFPKDVRALIKTGEQYGVNLKLVKATHEVNENQKLLLYNKIMTYFNNNIQNKVFAIWGLSFKPNTDDIREAPALKIIDKLLENNAVVRAYDPVAMDNVRKYYGNKIDLNDDMYEITKNADALILATEWSEFRMPDFILLSQIMKNKVIFDGRNIYRKEEVTKYGFEYFGIGC